MLASLLIEWSGGFPHQSLVDFLVGISILLHRISTFPNIRKPRKFLPVTKLAQSNMGWKKSPPSPPPQPPVCRIGQIAESIPLPPSPRLRPASDFFLGQIDVSIPPPPLPGDLDWVWTGYINDLTLIWSKIFIVVIWGKSDGMGWWKYPWKLSCPKFAVFSSVSLLAGPRKPCVHCWIVPARKAK